MSFSEYGQRKSKKDLKRKRLFRVYKRGGTYRSSEVEETKTNENKTSKKKK
jgi:hypothetical protein